LREVEKRKREGRGRDAGGTRREVLVEERTNKRVELEAKCFTTGSIVPLEFLRAVHVFRNLTRKSEDLRRNFECRSEVARAESNSAASETRTVFVVRTTTLKGKLTIKKEIVLPIYMEDEDGGEGGPRERKTKERPNSAGILMRPTRRDRIRKIHFQKFGDPQHVHVLRRTRPLRSSPEELRESRAHKKSGPGAHKKSKNGHPPHKNKKHGWRTKERKQRGREEKREERGDESTTPSPVLFRAASKQSTVSLSSLPSTTFPSPSISTPSSHSHSSRPSPDTPPPSPHSKDSPKHRTPSSLESPHPKSSEDDQFPLVHVPRRRSHSAPSSLPSQRMRLWQEGKKLARKFFNHNLPLLRIREGNLQDIWENIEQGNFSADLFDAVCFFVPSFLLLLLGSLLPLLSSSPSSCSPTSANSTTLQPRHSSLPASFSFHPLPLLPLH
jgi:hypothetical protein